ncbi:MAG: hypothetical protein ACK53Y_09900, partial [bacterium]
MIPVVRWFEDRKKGRDDIMRCFNMTKTVVDSSISLHGVTPYEVTFTTLIEYYSSKKEDTSNQ